MHLCVFARVQLEAYQHANGMATGPVTLASVARDRLQQVNCGTPSSAGSETGAATDVVVPKVDFPRPKYFKPRTHERRRSRDRDDFTGADIVASPAVSLPVLDIKETSPAT